MSEAKREPIPLRREEQPAAPQPATEAQPMAGKKRTGKAMRIVARISLMLFVPVLILLGGAYLYAHSGRYVSTDNAYVKADKVTVSADVSGRVVEIDVHENQVVKAGQVLFRLDDRPYTYALDRARAHLAAVRLQIESLRATYRQKQAELKAAEDTLAYQKREFDRQAQLLANHVTPQSKYDDARHALDAARQQVASIQEQILNVLASLNGDPGIRTHLHPLILEAKAQRDQAELDLAHTVIKAPADGIVSHVDQLQVGDYLNAATPAFALVSTNRVWIEANFKETELTHVHPGQKATVDVDTYPGVTFTAKVASISPGTGSEFSVLPAQNATGNWVKVVQRVPVRLLIENPDPNRPLRIGMSATVEVDTGHERSLLSLIHDAFAEPKTR